MVIAHITYGLTLGGIETMLVNIANEQVAAGHEVNIFVVNDLVDETLTDMTDKRVKYHFIGRKVGSRNPIPYFNLNRRLRALRPDVIHLHYASLSRYIFGKDLRSRLCVTLHAMTSPQNSRELHKCGPIFAISDMVRDDISEKKRLDSITVMNGINSAAIKEKTDFTRGDIFKIVQVSRLNHIQKGQDIAIRAVAKLKERGYRCRLTLIGEGQSEKFLKELTAELNLDDEVVFAGRRSQKYIFDHLRDFDLFLQPSRWEGFGLTVAEAMAAKLPVLVSDNQAPMEVIGYGKYGYFFKGEDYKACADKIQALIESGVDRRMVDEACRYVDDALCISATSRNYLHWYDELVVKPNNSKGK